MRIGNKDEHKDIISILDSIIVNKKQVISRKMIKSRLSEDDYIRIDHHLGDYLSEKNPIYIYLRYNEIYFQIRVDNNTLSGYSDYDEAKRVYNSIREEEITVKEIKDIKKKKKSKINSNKITLEDGFKRMLEKHLNEYEVGNVKYSSYTKKESTIKYHILPYFVDKPLAKITEGDIEDFVDQIKYRELSNRHRKNEIKKLSVAMQNEVFMYFKKIYKTTKRYFNIKTDIDIDEIMDEIVDKPNLRRARKRYNNKVGKIVENIYNDLIELFPAIKEIENGIYNPIVGIQLMIYFTGMRIDEVIALKPTDYNQQRKKLSIRKSISWHPNKVKTKKSYEVTATKTWDEREILLPGSICSYLEKYIKKLKELSFYSDEMFIFSRLDYARTKHEMLDPFSLKTFTNHIYKAYIKTGLITENETIPRNHIARHAFNTLLKNNHVEEYDRKAYLGHSHGNGVNEGYTHKSKEEEKRIVEISEYYCRKIVDELMKNKKVPN